MTENIDMLPTGPAGEIPLVPFIEVRETTEGEIVLAIPIDPDRAPVVFGLSAEDAVGFAARLLTALETVTGKQAGDLFAVDGGRYIGPPEEET